MGDRIEGGVGARGSLVGEQAQSYGPKDSGKGYGGLLGLRWLTGVKNVLTGRRCA